MLTEAMEWFKNVVSEPAIEAVAENDEYILYVDNKTGIGTSVPCLFKKRIWTALSIADVIGMAARFGSGDGDMSLYVSSQSVQAVLFEDTKSRSDRVTLKLNQHPAFKSLTTGMCAKPKAFCEFIRVHLFDCEVTPFDLRERLQQVKFHKSETTDTSAKHGDEQLGASITKKLSGATEIPSSCVVKFEPYPDLSEELNGIEVSVQCAITIDLDQGTLSLKPFPGQIAQATQEGMMAVAKLTREQAGDIPVFLGFTE